MITQAEIYTPIFDKIEQTEGAAEIGLWDDKIAFGATDKAAKTINTFISVMGLEARIAYSTEGNKAKTYHIEYIPLIAELSRAELLQRIREMQAQG